MRHRETQPYALRAIALPAAVMVIGLTAAGCAGISPESTGEPSVAAGSSASVNAGHSDVTRVAALVQIGIQEANQKNWSAATTTFKNVLALNPGNVYAMYNLGVIEQTNGNSAGAIGYYKSALAAIKQIDDDWLAGKLSR